MLPLKSTLPLPQQVGRATLNLINTGTGTSTVSIPQVRRQN